MAIKKVEKEVSYPIGTRFIDEWGEVKKIVSIDKDKIYELEREVSIGVPNPTLKSEHITRMIKLQRWKII